MNQQSADQFENEMPDLILQRALASIQAETIPPGPPSELVAATLHALQDHRTLQAIDESRTDPSPRPVFLRDSHWRKFMSRPVPRFAAMALAAASVCAVYFLLSGTSSTAAFAQMVDSIVKVKSARFNAVIEGKGLPKQTVRTLVLEPNRLRQEMPNGQVQIMETNVGKMMTLHPAQKSAILVNMTDMPAQQQPANYFDHLRTNLKAADHDASSKRESLGRKQIAGREAIGFRVQQPHAVMTIWGDPETGLPIMVEMEMAMLPDVKVTMTDFEFDVELDEALFKMELPDGYSLQELNVTIPTEKDLFGALKLLSDGNEGSFSDTFDYTAIAAFMANRVLKTPVQPDAAWTKKIMMSETLSLTQGLAFAAMLPVKSNARYAGKGIKYGDATNPVFWYRPVGASNYRVIYGDLSIRQQDDAPESPNAVPVTFGFSVNDAMRNLSKLRDDRPVLPLPPPLEDQPPPAAPLDPPVGPAVPAMPDEPEPKPDDPAARKIIDQMVKVYAACKSYRDSGMVTTLFVQETGNRTVEKPFTTAFVRPDRFRFEFKDMTFSPPTRYLIWSDGKDFQTWWDLTPGIKKPESLRLALAGATGISGGSARTIPALLLPGEVGGGNLSFITMATLAEDGKLGNVECFRVEGTYGKHPMTVWIDKKSYLVRRIDTQLKFPVFRTEQTTTYDPTVDEKITERMLEFDPPVQE